MALLIRTCTPRLSNWAPALSDSRVLVVITLAPCLALIPAHATWICLMRSSPADGPSPGEITSSASTSGSCDSARIVRM